MGTSTADLPDAEIQADTDILLIEGLTKRFGSFTAVDSVDISVTEGDFHAIIGPNGAGKTTLFNMITGSLPTSDGAIHFRGEDITEATEDARARSGIVRAYQTTQLFPDLSVHEHLRLAAQSRQQDFNLLHKPDSKFDQQATDMFESLKINADPATVAESLSHGNKKKLEIGMSVITDPDLLMLDEPTSGVSGSESEWIFEFIEEISNGLTVLLIEHDMDLILKYSDKITVLNRGEVIARGPPEDIVDDERVQEAYLGEY